MGTAVAARLLAQTFRIADADDIFSAAMLHDIGKIVLDVHFPSRYHPLLKKARQKSGLLHGKDFFELEESLLGITHAGIGNHLATKWKLPITITEVIECHHCPSEAKNCQPLVYTVALANEMAVLQYEKDGIYNREHFSPELLDYFNLSDEDMVRFMEELQSNMGSAYDLLRSISHL